MGRATLLTACFALACSAEPTDNTSATETGSTGSGETSTSGTSGTSEGSSSSTGAAIDNDITLANLNVLHGFFCPDPTGDCRLTDRMDLFFSWIEAYGCPDVVTVQEASAMVQSLIKARLSTTACGFNYRFSLADAGIVDNLILSRYPVTESVAFPLHGGVDRHVQLARIDHPTGALDVFTTHLASSVDNGGDPCESAGACPTACLDAGASSIRDCEAVQVADVVTANARPDAVALTSGDFNATANSFAIQHLTGRGFIDTHLAAGNAECDPQTGEHCTTGRDDGQLENPAHNQSARIDFVFLLAQASGCAASIEMAGDPDGDGTFTGPFAHLPNPFMPACGPAPAPVCWPSDHDGNALDLECQ